jgi:tetratricopeptide (TPR) repeat protein
MVAATCFSPWVWLVPLVAAGAYCYLLYRGGVLYRRGHAMLQQERFEGAMELFTRALKFPTVGLGRQARRSREAALLECLVLWADRLASEKRYAEAAGKYQEVIRRALLVGQFAPSESDDALALTEIEFAARLRLIDVYEVWARKQSSAGKPGEIGGCAAAGPA